MKRTLLISVATAALFAGSGLVLAQAPSAPAGQNAPSDKAGPAEKMAPMNRSAPETRPGAEKGAEGGNHERAHGEKGSPQHTQGTETKPGMSSGGKAGSETKEKSEGGMKAEPNGSSTKGTKSGATSGQAGAGSKQLTSEQRTSVRTAIRGQNVKPVTNVNFAISVGTRVPRTVTFHPLPTELVTIYPAWQGYEYFLVGEEIIVVNPRTLEIVAVLEA
jgi:hypothetical protein